MSDVTQVSGTTGGLFGSLIIRAAGVYQNPTQALLEYLQNSADETMTRRIWIVLDKKNSKISIIDDGPGMGGPMLSEDREIANLFYGIVASGDSPGCDLRDLINVASMHTGEWIVTSIANSVKSNSRIAGDKPNKELEKFANKAQTNKEQNHSKMGKHGIGGWAYLYLANQMTITSKPNLTLADQLGINVGDIPTFVIVPPGKGKLRNSDLRYSISTEQGETVLIDDNGNPLPHGTRIDITEVDDTAWSDLTLPHLSAQLRSDMGTRIEQTGLEIFIVDLDLNQTEKVQPQVIRGTVILKETFLTSDGTPNQVFIYYDPKARNLYPQVKKYGVTICRLNEVSDVNGSIFSDLWFSGRLGGWISYEHVNDDNLFDSAKHHLVDSRERRHWVREVKRFESRINLAIEQIENQSKDERYKESSNLIAKATKEALASQGIQFSQSTKKTPDKPVQKRIKTKLQHIIVTVIDKSGKGLPNISLELEGPDRVFHKTTGASGAIQFFRGPVAGKYSLTVLGRYTEKGLDPVAIVGEDRVTFQINPNEGIAGMRIRFIVNEGEERKSASAESEIAMNFNLWDDPDEPWRQAIYSHLPIIEFNLNQYTWLRQLFDSEHTLEAHTLMAEYVASAISSANGYQGNHADRIRQSNLFEAILKAMNKSNKIEHNVPEVRKVSKVRKVPKG